jgi:hypothetical protein
VSATAILRECSKRSIHLRTERGVIVARPKGKTPDNLRARVVEHKAELIILLGSDWDEGSARELLTSTLDVIEGRGSRQPEEVSDRTIALLAEFRPVIAGLFVAQDLPSLRACMLDLERNANNINLGRGYDNPPRLRSARSAMASSNRIFNSARCLLVI